jgi:hypothetical protein
VYALVLQSAVSREYNNSGSLTAAKVWFRMDAFGQATAAEVVNRCYRSDPAWHVRFELDPALTAWARDWATEGDFVGLAVFQEPDGGAVKVARLPHIPDAVDFIMRQFRGWLPGVAAKAAAKQIMINRGDYTAQEVALLEGEPTTGLVTFDDYARSLKPPVRNILAELLAGPPPAGRR